MLLEARPHQKSIVGRVEDEQFQRGACQKRVTRSRASSTR